MTFSAAERDRYARQLDLPGWGEDEQERLRRSSAIVVGAGGLGSPAATYLAAAGVGRLGIVDSEPVQPASLARQPLHYTPDVGIGKADNAVVKLAALNPETEADAYPVRLERANAEAIVAGADVVLDCADSEDSRKVVNEACCAEGVPLVVAALAGALALVLSVRPGRTACWCCALPSEGDLSQGELGALGAVAGLVGSIQALEALKLLCGVGEPLTDRLLQLDARDMSQTVVDVARRAGCPACARVPAPAQSL